MTSGLSVSQMVECRANPLFSGKSWKWSPYPWSMDANSKEQINALGPAAFSFYRAIETLYRKSSIGESILRNQDLLVPWVAEYYDAGKPEWLVAHTRSKQVRGALPAVLRPDLLSTDQGLSLVEWDSVPGGIGLTAQLENLYGMGADDRMVQAFGDALVSAVGRPGRDARMAIVVSEESETYRPEMEWLAEKLKSTDLNIKVCAPEELSSRENGIFLGEEKLALIYRFWELFDFEQIPIMRELSKQVESGNVIVTPPMKHIQEEKLSLALFHHYRLQSFWEENITPTDLSLLRSLIPKSWILDPVKIPPGAHLDGPICRGMPLSEWMDLSGASKKERALVIKASGFHETAWGARSVVLGNDVSSAEWTSAIQQSLHLFPRPVSILQEFHKPVQSEHPLFNDEDEPTMNNGRVRLSPYFFVSKDQAKWVGSLATFCPADKKIIHGMSDGALMPCIR